MNGNTMSYPNQLSHKIEKQSSNSLNFKNLTNDLLNKEIKIISKNGKYFYLTE